jgi:hypothetical protein
MRTDTFNIIGTVIFGVILFSVYGIFAYLDLWLPRTGWHLPDLALDYIQSKLAEIIMAIMAIPLYVFVMHPMFLKLRAWRKARGRDIEEEEKYETEFGILTLTEKKHKNELEGENYLLNRGLQWYRRRSRN